MTDLDLRALARAYEESPTQGALEHLIAASRRVGVPVPARLLLARETSPREATLRTMVAHWTIAPGTTDPFGGFSRPTFPWRGREVQRNSYWGLSPRKEPSSEEPWSAVHADMIDHAIPGLELVASSPALVEQIARDFGHLRYLSLAGALSDEMVAALARLRALEMLNLRLSSQPRDAAWPAKLAALPHLTGLRIETAQPLPVASTKALGELRGLTHLELSGATGREDALVGVASLEYLEGLDVTATHVEPKVLASVARLPRLRKLELVECGPLDDRAFRGLAQLGELRFLAIRCAAAPSARAIAAVKAALSRCASFSVYVPEPPRPPTPYPEGYRSMGGGRVDGIEASD